MTSTELSALVDSRKPGAVSFSLFARDVTTVSGATLLAAVFGTLVVFLIPRLVSVEEFGYWRLFLLYAGYVGFFHLGFPDGALLRWAGKSLREFHHEIGPSASFLIGIHLAVAVVAGLLLSFVVPLRFRWIGVGILVFALIMNCVILLQSALQGARIFKPVAVATAAPTGLFVLLTLLLRLRAAPSFRELIFLYLLAWAICLAYLWLQVRPRLDAWPGSAWHIGQTCTLLGWPILLANGGLSLMQSADRLVVSMGLPIYDFAQYSLAASAMFVPASAITATYRVFFSHVAALERDDRSRVYPQVSRLLLVAWSLLLPYGFILESFVRQFLPQYVLALPLAATLLLGVLFLAEIQILQMSFSYLEGKQRQFLAVTVAAMSVSFSLAAISGLWMRSLEAVAVAQVVALAIWWTFNEWALHKLTRQRILDWLRLIVVFAWAGFSYRMALRGTENPFGRILLYYGLLAGALLFVCRSELRLCFKLLLRSCFTPREQVGA